MNTSFLNSIKRIMNPKITGLIIIAFASVLFLGCNNDNKGGAKKTDPATQSNEQKGDDKHKGMDHDAPGMDTMHRKKQE